MAQQIPISIFVLVKLVAAYTWLMKQMHLESWSARPRQK